MLDCALEHTVSVQFWCWCAASGNNQSIGAEQHEHRTEDSHRRRRRGPSRVAEGPAGAARRVRGSRRQAPRPKGIDVVKSEHLDLVLLDVGLPDMDGREACKLLRKNGFKSPIVMLTGNVSDADMILGPRLRRQRLHHQALQVRRAAGPHPRAAAPARAERGRGVRHRPLLVQAGLEDADRREGLQDPAHGEGDLDPRVPLSRRARRS